MKNEKTIEDVRADKGIGTQLTTKEFREQMQESLKKKCGDYKTYLEANGYRVTKVSRASSE